MGHKHSKPNPPAHKNPGNCPTIFECQWKRAEEVIKDTFNTAYENETMVLHIFMCLLIVMFVLGVCAIYLRMHSLREDVRVLQRAKTNLAVTEVEKGYSTEFNDKA